MSDNLRLQKAKKDYTCHLCKGKILKGDKYWRHLMGEDGIDLKEHTNCELYNASGTKK